MYVYMYVFIDALLLGVCVSQTHRMLDIYKSFFAKEPYNSGWSAENDLIHNLIHKAS